MLFLVSISSKVGRIKSLKSSGRLFACLEYIMQNSITGSKASLKQFLLTLNSMINVFYSSNTLIDFCKVLVSIEIYLLIV